MKAQKIFYFKALMTIFMLYQKAEAQVENDTIKRDNTGAIERLTYQQQPGLAMAASKIFFSEKPYSISGFGELNYIPIQQNVNTDVGDLELYYSGLYRFSTFFGYRITDNLIWNSEILFEFLHYKNQESFHEFVIEAFLDYQFKPYLNFRTGFFPLTVGYINSHDEPIMFYSVNRSDVERLIIPTTWVELGGMLYGSITNDLSYTLGISQGLNSTNYIGGSWIRQGRETRFELPKKMSFSPQLNFTGFKNTVLSVSGYYGNSGQGNSVIIDGVEETVNATIKLTSAYLKYNYEEFDFLAVGTYGTLSDTEKIYKLTEEIQSQGQVLGNKVYGYLFEVGYNFLPLLRGQNYSAGEGNFLIKPKESKLSLFSRFERLNTHKDVHPTLQDLNRVTNDLEIYTLGINYNPRENVVFKANYQYRVNKYVFDQNPINNVVEFGIGFIF